MATTTNYGWTTPDDTALVKDGASAIRSLGTSVDTTTKNLNPETTLGDIAYRSSTANVKTRLGIGSTGQVLTVAGGVPSWASPAGGGKVLQVVNATYNTQTSNTNGTTYEDTGLSATITPSSASSKVLVFVSQSGVAKTGSNIGVMLRLLRAGSSILEFESGVGYNGGGGLNSIGGVSLNYLDSPATTSATTYKTQFARDFGSGTVIVQYKGSAGDTTSTITLMEIGA